MKLKKYQDISAKRHTHAIWGAPGRPGTQRTFHSAQAPGCFGASRARLFQQKTPTNILCSSSDGWNAAYPDDMMFFQPYSLALRNGNRIVGGTTLRPSLSRKQTRWPLAHMFPASTTTNSSACNYCLAQGT